MLIIIFKLSGFSTQHLNILLPFFSIGKLCGR